MFAKNVNVVLTSHYNYSPPLWYTQKVVAISSCRLSNIFYQFTTTELLEEI